MRRIRWRRCRRPRAPIASPWACAPARRCSACARWRAGRRSPARGFSLHAAVRLASHQRKELERLCRYITRPALANERLSRDARGQVVLKLKSPYRNGTTHIVMQPQEFMQRLAALVPRPRLHLIRFHGVLAPNAKLRGAVIPQPAQKDGVPGQEHTQGQAARMRWARLLKRVFHTSIWSAARAVGS